MRHYRRRTAIGECRVGWPHGASLPQCRRRRRRLRRRCSGRQRTPPPLNIEGPDFADVPPPDLGACRDVSNGMTIILDAVVVVPLSLSLLSLSPRRDCPAVIAIVVFVSR